MSIAVFDLDGTLIQHNSSFSFCRYLHRKGLLTNLDLFYCSTLYARHVLFGLSVWDLHTRAFNRLFKGKWIKDFSPFITPFIQTLSWYEPALERLNRLRVEGAQIHIFSNSPFFLVKPIAAEIGVDNVVATDYKIDKAGRLWNIATFVDGEKKSQMLQRLGKETIAFSDSHHDLPFLESASHAVAVAPTKPLLKIAHQRNWEIL